MRSEKLVEVEELSVEIKASAAVATVSSGKPRAVQQPIVAARERMAPRLMPLYPFLRSSI